ncbi:hypothetical protein [Aliikangiella sp. IMCC44359]|uniref:hypothetical protein n=1 Tax=Aliikangiella sp. IMCC44359 TaxID=3459125 RepID=UPI00403AA453
MKHFIILLIALNINFVNAEKTHAEKHYSLICQGELNKRFKLNNEIYKRERHTEETLNDIYYALKCDEAKIGLKLSNILVSKGGWYGYYYRYRFNKIIEGGVSKSSLNDLMRSANMGYSRAIFELYEYYFRLGELEKSEAWLKLAAKEYNRKAIYLILTDKLKREYYTDKEFEFFALAYWFLIIPEELKENKFLYNRVNEIISNITKERYHFIMTEILNKYRYNFCETEIGAEVPLKPWNY